MSNIFTAQDGRRYFRDHFGAYREVNTSTDLGVPSVHRFRTLRYEPRGHSLENRKAVMGTAHRMRLMIQSTCRSIFHRGGALTVSQSFTQEATITRSTTFEVGCLTLHISPRDCPKKSSRSRSQLQRQKPQQKRKNNDTGKITVLPQRSSRFAERVVRDD